MNQTDVEFKESYLKLANDVDEIARDIISHARDTEEVTFKIGDDATNSKQSADCRESATPVHTCALLLLITHRSWQTFLGVKFL